MLKTPFLEAQELVGSSHHLGAVDGTLDGAVGFGTHDIDRQSARVGAELSHGPRHVRGVVHDRVIQKRCDGREAEA